MEKRRLCEETRTTTVPAAAINYGRWTGDSRFKTGLRRLDDRSRAKLAACLKLPFSPGRRIPCSHRHHPPTPPLAAPLLADGWLVIATHSHSLHYFHKPSPRSTSKLARLFAAYPDITSDLFSHPHRFPYSNTLLKSDF